MNKLNLQKFLKVIEIGKYNTLSAIRKTDHGIYLTDIQGNEVLLPNAYVPEGLNKGDEIQVFIYRDSEDRLVATTLKPKILLNEFALLKASHVDKIGAFMDWGLQKDLLVPFAEQKVRMIAGNSYIVYLYLDEATSRLTGSSRVESFIQKKVSDLKVNDQVELLVYEKTELGYKVIINYKHMGLLYKNEVFEVLIPGAKRVGYIKKLREDNKIDVTLQQQGFINVESSVGQLLKVLKENNGFLGLTDYSHPEEIMIKLRMSKKTFKKAVGILYKKKQIVLEKEGIRLKA